MTACGLRCLRYRLLTRLRGEDWPQDLLDMMYLEDETRAWAEVGSSDEEKLVHRDSNGAVLEAGVIPSR